LLADRLLRAPVAPGRDTGEHPLQHDPGQRITISEMLVRAQRHLGVAVSGPDPGPGNLDATATERHPAVLMAVAHCSPVRVPATFRAHDIVDLFLHQLAQHTEP
jgi:hypothetical protein